MELHRCRPAEPRRCAGGASASAISARLPLAPRARRDLLHVRRAATPSRAKRMPRCIARSAGGARRSRRSGVRVGARAARAGRGARRDAAALVTQDVRAAAALDHAAADPAHVDGAGAVAARRDLPPLAGAARTGAADVAPTPQRGRWHRAATLRRVVLLVLVLAQTVLATDFMTAVLPYHGTQPLELAILALFAILFCWVSAGFWTAMAGFRAARARRDRYAISRATARPDAPIDPRRAPRSSCRSATRTCARVFAGLRATYESLARTGALDALRFLRAERHAASPTSRVAERRGVARRCAARVRRLRAHLLPLAPAPHQAQERQRRRLLPPLGQRLPLHGRARRRQRDDRRLPDDAGAPDGGEPRRRHHPDRAARARPRHAVCARAAVRDARLRAAVHRRPALLAARRIALLGPQRDHPRRAVHAPLRARPPARAAARCPARSCRTISSRPR